MGGSKTYFNDEEAYNLTVMAGENFAENEIINNVLGSNFCFMEISNSGSNYDVVKNKDEITTIATSSFTSGKCYSSLFGFTTSAPSLTKNTEGVITPESCETLHIELSSFSGVNKGNTNVLNWTTSSEPNNDYFNIESSVNGINWKSVGKMNGIGNSNSLQHYSWIDHDPAFPVTYYRLKQNDFNGAFHYSNIIEITKEIITEFEISEIFPNPVIDILLFKYKGNDNRLNVFIYNGLGQLIKKIDYPLIKNNHVYTIDMSELPKGIYFVKFLQDKLQFTSKIVK